jgi:hypothetical protein
MKFLVAFRIKIFSSKTDKEFSPFSIKNISDSSVSFSRAAQERRKHEKDGF